MGGGAQSSIENLSVTYVSSATERPLFGKILNTPTLKNEYLRTFSTLFNSYFSPARLFPVIDSIANLVRPFVYEDTRKTYTNQEFETNIASDLTEAGGGLGGGGVPRDSTRVGFPGDSTRVGVPGGGGSRKPGLKSFISARHANVQSQLAAFGITSTEKTEEVPTSYGLEQNYPNPFNPRTTIRYQLPARGHVSLRVYDMMGREVAVLADAEQEGGHRSVVFDASNLPSGVYFYRLIVGSFVETKKLVVLR
jgi:hypothetical protein